MGYPVQQSTTNQDLYFFMKDSSDHVTGKSGLSPTVKIKPYGQSAGAPAGAVSQVDATNLPGWYKAAANATDNAFLGPLLLYATSAGADPVAEEFMVVAFNPLDAALLGMTGIPAAVWNAVMASYLTAGTTGAKLNSAAAAGDPLLNSVPGSYGLGTAGYNLGQLGAGSITFTGPVIAANNDFSVIQGDDYLNADGNAFSWTFGATPNLTSATVVLRIQTPTITQITGTISGAGTSAQIVRFDMSRTITGGFNPGNYSYDIQATLSSASVVTLVSMAGMRVRTQVI